MASAGGGWAIRMSSAARLFEAWREGNLREMGVDRGATKAEDEGSEARHASGASG